MGWQIWPLAVFFFFFGMTMMQAEQANSKQGAGLVGVMDQRATVTAQQAEAFAYGCYTSASSQPGLISSSVNVTMPAGVNVPSGANCVTTANASYRNVFGYMPVAPGAVRVILADAHDSTTWFKVTQQGSATNLETGEAAAVPAQIPVGDIVNYVIADN